MRDRSAGQGPFTEDLHRLLDRTWFEYLETGYCSAELCAVEDELAVLIDTGLISAIEVAARFVARHFRDGLFDGRATRDVERDAFGRAYSAYVGQFFLHGRIRHPFPLGRDPEPLTRHIAREALLFVAGHELGHALAGHSPGDMGTRWLQVADVDADLRPFAAEVEADALAVQLLLGDLWDRRVAEGELQARILAMRMTFRIMETVERCALTAQAARHLPAERRWRGIRSALEQRIPVEFLERVDRDWATLSMYLAFADVHELLPPDEGLLDALRLTGWGPGADASSETWAGMEMAAWQFRLHPMILCALIGAEAARVTDMSDDDEVARAQRVGSQVVDEVLAGLPAWLTGDSDRSATTASSDLLSYLRVRARWPEPFCGDEHLTLPIHLVASVAARRIDSRQRAGAVPSDATTDATPGDDA